MVEPLGLRLAELFDPALPETEPDPEPVEPEGPDELEESDELDEPDELDELEEPEEPELPELVPDPELLLELLPEVSVAFAAKSSRY